MSALFLPRRFGITRARLALIGGLVASLAFVQCVGDEPTLDEPDAGQAPDASTADTFVPPDGDVTNPDGGSTTCAWDEPFATVAPLTGFATAASEGHPSLSPDELNLYFHGSGGTLDDGGDDSNLYIATRGSRTSDFGAPTKLKISTLTPEKNPAISSDGKTLYYDSSPDGGVLTALWFAKRTDPTVQFVSGSPLPSPPASLGAGVSVRDTGAFLSADNAEFWFVSARDGGSLDLYSSQNSGGTFGTAVFQSSLSTTYPEYAPGLSADRLTVYFASGRPGGTGGEDIYRSHRSSTSDAFGGSISAVTELNSTASDYGGWISPDNCRIYFETMRSGNSDIYVAERAP